MGIADYIAGKRVEFSAQMARAQTSLDTLEIVEQMALEMEELKRLIKYGHDSIELKEEIIVDSIEELEEAMEDEEEAIEELKEMEEAEQDELDEAEPILVVDNLEEPEPEPLIDDMIIVPPPSQEPPEKKEKTGLNFLF